MPPAWEFSRVWVQRKLPSPKGIETWMPRYFLHVCNGNGFTEDEEGLDLPSAEIAREKAIEGLRDIMADELKGGVINMASFIEIEDENKQLVETISFLDAVQVETRHGKRPGK